MRFKFSAGAQNYSAWYLVPTIRFGTYSGIDQPGWFLALTFLKFDACLSSQESLPTKERK